MPPVNAEQKEYTRLSLSIESCAPKSYEKGVLAQTITLSSPTNCALLLAGPSMRGEVPGICAVYVAPTFLESTKLLMPAILQQRW